MTHRQEDWFTPYLQRSASSKTSSNFCPFFLIFERQTVGSYGPCDIIKALESCLRSCIRKHALGERATDALNVRKVFKVAVVGLGRDQNEPH